MLMLDVSYGSTPKILAHHGISGIVSSSGSGDQGCVTRLPTPFLQQQEPGAELVVDSAALVRVVEEALASSEYQLAVFDHITSNTAALLPVADLVRACRAAGVPCLVDGAHAPGQLDGGGGLHLEDLGADYYVGNCHKWLCCPRGSAFIYVREGRTDSLHPSVVSHGQGAGFLSEFIWDGARDYAPALAVPAALQFWRWVDERRRAEGESTRAEYVRELRWAAVGTLASEWFGECGSGASSASSPPGMALVPLPDYVCRSAMVRDRTGTTAGSATPADSTAAKCVQDWLHHDYSIEVPVKSVGGRLYARLSVHVHNEIADYEHLAAAVSGLASG